MKLIRSIVASGALALVASIASASPVVIDDFSDEGPGGFFLGVGNGSVPGFGATASYSQGGLTGVLGGAREATLTAQVVSSGVSATASIGPDPLNASLNRLFFSQSASEAATFSINWDGTADGVFNPLGLGGIDIATGTAMAFRIFADLEVSANPDPYEIDLLVTDMNGNSSVLSFNAVDTGGTFIEVLFPFGDFVGTADFTNVGGIRAILNSGAATGDYRVSVDVSFGTVSVPVPEPGALLLVSSALLGLWATTRRRNVV